MRICLMVAAFCCFCKKNFAQIEESTWQIGAHAGYSVYQGDLTPNIFSGYKSLSYNFGISGTKIIDPYFSVKLKVSYGQIKADESKYSSFHKDRAFLFSTKVTEITPLVSWNIIGNNFQEIDQDFSPYLFAGVGMAFFSVNRDYSKLNRNVFGANNWVNKGMVVDSTTSLPRSAFLIPIGAGTDYYINDDFSLIADFTYRFCFTDYLDGVSKSGNSKRNDTYHTLTIGFIHTLFTGSAGGIKNPRPVF